MEILESTVTSLHVLSPVYLSQTEFWATVWSVDRLKEGIFYILEWVRDIKGTLASKGCGAWQCFSGTLQGVGEKAVPRSPVAPQGSCVPCLHTSTWSVPNLANFLSEKVPSDIRASGAWGDVVKADVTDYLAPVRMWLWRAVSLSHATAPSRMMMSVNDLGQDQTVCEIETILCLRGLCVWQDSSSKPTQA